MARIQRPDASDAQAATSPRLPWDSARGSKRVMSGMTARRPRAHLYQLDAAVGLTPDERADRGKAARAAVPRESHAAFDPPAGRPDPVSLLEEQASSRVPELVPIRYGRMLESPFSYFRGAALPMASDLACTPVTGLAVQACGDAHLNNFGIFGSAERHLVFDVNDFDETLPGPWEWDVKRLAASLEVVARDNGCSGKRRRTLVRAAVTSYRKAMRSFAGMTNLDVWYAQADMDRLRARLDASQASHRKRIDKGLTKARTHDSMQELGKLTRTVGGRPRIISNPPLLVPVAELVSGPGQLAAFAAQLRGVITQYQRTLAADRRFLLDEFEFCDMARKVVGVGSVGTRCWIGLMLGRDSNDPLFLQVKEADKSVLSWFAGPSRYKSQGERVVAGQRQMQASSDVFLGWHRAEVGLDGQQRDFYVRQLRDWKYSFDTAAMKPQALRLYGELCGWTLARAHARSGDRIAIAAYLGGGHVFDDAITKFAAAYADQNETDYQALASAVSSGRITADRAAC